MPQVGFETKFSAGERTRIYALDRAATGTGDVFFYWTDIVCHFLSLIL